MADVRTARPKKVCDSNLYMHSYNNNQRIIANLTNGNSGVGVMKIRVVKQKRKVPCYRKYIAIIFPRRYEKIALYGRLRV